MVSRFGRDLAEIVGGRAADLAVRTAGEIVLTARGGAPREWKPIAVESIRFKYEEPVYPSAALDRVEQVATPASMEETSTTLGKLLPEGGYRVVVATAKGPVEIYLRTDLRVVAFIWP